MKKEFCNQEGRGVEAMISVPLRPIARRATNTFRGERGCSVVRYPTVGVSSLASATCVETVFVKEEFEWRRGGVQSVRTEW